MILLKIKVGIGRSRNSKVSSRLLRCVGLVKVLQRDGLNVYTDYIKQTEVMQ